MKKNLLLTLISLLISGNIFAQNDELFTIMSSENISKLKMSNSQKDVFEKTSKDIYLKKMDIVQIGDISKIQKRGTLTFTLPRFGKVTAKAKKIESLGKENFKWIGEILGEGMVYIYNKNGNISGHISLGNTSYQINSLGNNFSVLAEIDRKKMKSIFCEGKGAVKSNKDTPKSPSGERVEPCGQTDKIRVLVLYTQRAVDAVGLPSLIDRLNVSVDQFNLAYSVSSVTNPRAQITLIGSELTNFTERTGGGLIDDELDVNDLANFAANRKATANADIVVCLVDAGYVRSRGIARTINAQNDNEAYATVEVRVIPDQPVFPHEIGHLLGGRHHNDNTSGDAHGFQYEIDFGFLNLGRKDYCTIMCPQMPEEVRRSDRWSNPNVSDGGNATGTSNFNNVARVIGSNASRIADFRPNTGALGLYIEGEFTVTQLGYKTYESVVSCGSGPYTYLWERSNDGFNYFGAETSEFYTFYAYPDGSNSVYLRLTVTSADNRTATTFNRIDFVGYQGSRISANNVSSNDDNLGYTDQNKLIQIAYPNPTNNQVKVTIYLSKDDNAKVSMINGQGQEVKIIHQGELLKGSHNFDISVQSLTPGQYFIKTISSEKSESIKIIVQK